MKTTRRQLKRIIKEEIETILKEWDNEPTLAFEHGEVVLRSGGMEYPMSIEEFLNMKSPSYDPDVVEIETADMAGKSIDIPKEIYDNAAQKLKQQG
jgi:hypothetical protein